MGDGSDNRSNPSEQEIEVLQKILHRAPSCPIFSSNILEGQKKKGILGGYQFDKSTNDKNAVHL